MPLYNNMNDDEVFENDKGFSFNIITGEGQKKGKISMKSPEMLGFEYSVIKTPGMRDTVVPFQYQIPKKKREANEVLMDCSVNKTRPGDRYSSIEEMLTEKVERVSDKLYMNLEKENINELVIEALKYLRVKGPLAMKIYRAANGNKFHDINYAEEIRRTEEKVSEVEVEKQKWMKIYSEQKTETEEKILASLYPVYQTESESINKEKENLVNITAKDFDDVRTTKNSFMAKFYNLSLFVEKIDFTLRKYRSRANKLLEKLLMIDSEDENELLMHPDGIFILKAMTKVDNSYLYR